MIPNDELELVEIFLDQFLCQGGNEGNSKIRQLIDIS